MKQTFAQLEGERVLSVPAGVELGAVQEGAHIMHEHCVPNHGQLCARAFPFHQLEHVQQEGRLFKWTQILVRDPFENQVICVCKTPRAYAFLFHSHYKIAKSSGNTSI